MAPDADAAKSSKRTDPFAPLTSEMLAVGDGHEIYVESVGRADGIPAVYLHGGPGSGCQPDHRRLFDPERFCAVLFDQRGAGKSRPRGGREHNTLAHRIADMEMIRQKFGFARWMLVGGSWGATLALAYAEAHPERVSSIVLRATFLGTRAEVDIYIYVSEPCGCDPCADGFSIRYSFTLSGGTGDFADANGTRTGNIEIMLVAFGPNGDILNFVKKRSNLTMDPRVYEATQQVGMQIHEEIDAPG